MLKEVTWGFISPFSPQYKQIFFHMESSHQKHPSYFHIILLVVRKM